VFTKLPEMKRELKELRRTVAELQKQLKGEKDSNEQR